MGYDTITRQRYNMIFFFLVFVLTQLINRLTRHNMINNNVDFGLEHLNMITCL